MRILLDTHAFLWFVLGDSKLSSPARTHIENPQYDKLISPASYWEIAVKISIGKYALPQSYDDFIKQGIGDNGFEILPIIPDHTSMVTNLPFHHRDPFDRLIVAQALAEQVAVVSADAIFDAYSVNRLW